MRRAPRWLSWAVSSMLKVPGAHAARSHAQSSVPGAAALPCPLAVRAAAATLLGAQHRRLRPGPSVWWLNSCGPVRALSGSSSAPGPPGPPGGQQPAPPAGPRSPPGPQRRGVPGRRTSRTTTSGADGAAAAVQVLPPSPSPPPPAGAAPQQPKPLPRARRVSPQPERRSSRSDIDVAAEQSAAAAAAATAGPTLQQQQQQQNGQGFVTGPPVTGSGWAAPQPEAPGQQHQAAAQWSPQPPQQFQQQQPPPPPPPQQQQSSPVYYQQQQQQWGTPQQPQSQPQVAVAAPTQPQQMPPQPVVQRAPPAAVRSSAGPDEWRKLPTEMNQRERLEALCDLLEEEWDGEPLPDLVAGRTVRATCPHCGNGRHNDDCFAVTVTPDALTALWCCHRATCGNTGGRSLLGERGVSRAQGLDAPAGSRAGSGPSAAAAAGWAPPRSALLQQLARGSSSSTSTSTSAAAGPAPSSRATARNAAPSSDGVRVGPPPPHHLERDFEPLTPELISWFAARGIGRETLSRNGIALERRFTPSGSGGTEWIAFPYRRDGAVVNVKYRALPKSWRQSRGGAKVLYGYDEAKRHLQEGGEEIIIVEGELDKLALNEAGLWNVVSVPDGAPSKPQDGPLPSSAADTKFSYVHACEGLLAAASRVVLATDNDAPGLALAHELARRLGRDRCYVVQWPSDAASSLAARRGAGTSASAAAGVGAEATGAVDDGSGGVIGGSAEGEDDAWFRKDANEVLLSDGPDDLRAYIAAAQPLPVTGLLRFGHFWGELYDLYCSQGATGRNAAASTGWPGLDACYKVAPGELSLVTGVPNSGKSEWLDALAVNLAASLGWRFGLCSLENERLGHLVKLLEKRVGKPFYDGAGGRVRMSWEEAVAGWQWVDEMFHRIVPPPGEQLPSIDFVLERARILVLRFGIRGLIIDPYNELDHRRSSHVTETEFVSQMLTKIKRFAQAHDVHVWLVAHPRQLQDWRGEAPNLYDVSGSAHFINKADCGLVVHRPFAGGFSRGAGPGAANGRGGGGGRGSGPPGSGEGDPALVQVLVRKMRNKAAGRIGDSLLRYDRATGRYADEPSGGAHEAAR